MVEGVPTWGAIRPDVSIAFPDGSFRRPDIAIFRREPDEIDTAVTLIPKAVAPVAPGSVLKLACGCAIAF